MRKNKIRILHVAQAAGGVDRYIRMLLKYLDKEKFENILVCSQDFHEEDYRDLVDSSEQVEMTRAIGGNDLKAIKEVRTLIKKYNPDIVYAHSSKAGAIARVADIGLKNHCVYNPHGWAFNMRCSAKKKAMYTAIEKVAAPFCDKIICISDAEKQSALDKKICREDKLQVIFNGVDIESYENGVHGAVKRKDLNIPEDAFVVGMVGRMSPQKAPDVFVKMAKQVKDTVPNAHFIIVGTGNQEAEIRKYAKDNGFSDSLHITGWVDNPMSYVELFDVALGYINPLAVRSNYPESKRLCENMCVAFWSEYGVPVKIARLSQTFGAGILSGENRVFAQFARSAIEGKDIVLHTRGLSEGNYCYTRDTIMGLFLILIKGENAEAYNVTNPETHTTIVDMARMVCQKFGNGKIKVVFDIPESNQFGYAADTKMKLNADKLKNLGWRPEIGLEEAYRRMIMGMKREG